MEDAYMDDTANNSCIGYTKIALTAIIIVACWYLSRKPRGIPPGPKFTLPIIGDFLALRGSKDPRLTFRKLRKQHGDIFSFYMGQHLVVCMNGYDLIKDALVKHGDKFSDRPSTLLNEVLANHKGIVFSSGHLWKRQRTFALETLREFGFGRTILEDKILDEVDVFVDALRKNNGKEIDIHRLLELSIANIMSSMVFGKRFDHDDAMFNDMLNKIDDNLKLLDLGNILNFFPALSYIPGDLFHYKQIRKNFEHFIKMVILPSIESHEKNYDENDSSDYISRYIGQMKAEEKRDPHIDKENLSISINDLFLAGTETTFSMILWTILYLLHYPECQEKAFAEIQEVIGTGRQPSLKDREAMPYTQALIAETLRVVNIALTNVPHGVAEDTVFRGFFIPKGTILLPNIDSILADDNIWGDASTFRPERFIDADGKFVKREELTPFSLGRRVCLGEAMAKMELFLFITTLVQRFEVLPADPKNLPPLAGVIGVTHIPQSFQFRPVPRN